MLGRLIEWSVRNVFLVLVMALATMDAPARLDATELHDLIDRVAESRGMYQ